MIPPPHCLFIKTPDTACHRTNSQQRRHALTSGEIKKTHKRSFFPPVLIREADRKASPTSPLPNIVPQLSSGSMFVLQELAVQLAQQI